MKDSNSPGLWGVIFDMDGVLIDSYHAHLCSWKKMLRNHGLDITEEQFSITFGRTNQDILAQLYPSVKSKDYPLLSEEKEAAFREIITNDFPGMDGAGALITSLHKAGARLAIGSSGPPDNIQAVLSALPGGEYFAAVTTGDDVRHGKPDPGVFLVTAEKLGLSPGRCVVIEDAPAGVRAGKDAGCAVVGLTGTARRENLLEADLVVDALHHLTPGILQNLILKASTAKGSAESIPG
jgi:beta-phosphoglucomutase